LKAVTSNGVPAASCSENDNKQGQSERWIRGKGKACKTAAGAACLSLSTNS
jgi:hypothetical protein